MKFLIVLALSTATVLSMPLAEPEIWTHPSGLRLRGKMDQGDGYYSASFNEEGIADIKFTPASQLNYTMNHTASSVSTKRSASYISTCNGATGNWQDMDQANVNLGHAADDDGCVKGPHWGWQNWGSATAYYCAYQDWCANYDAIISFNINTSKSCAGGSAAYGYSERGSPYVSVGRTSRYDHFCTSTFTGGR